ncbi:hypothetical protein ACVWZK_006399 [Bradyrhizobium sp. GM0.4]
MMGTVVIPALIVSLLACFWLALKIWYANHGARMTPAERAAEDRGNDPDQIW